MPTVISESDSFDATVQRPNNGELADAASILLTAQKVVNRSRYTYNRLRTRIFDVTRAGYGADPSGLIDSTAAIQDAINDAAAGVGCGDVFLPGVFKYTALTVPLGVRLLGLPNLTRLMLNHATNDGITFTGSPRRSLTEIRDISFCAQIDNTGKIINIPVSAEVKLSNVAFNDDLSGGGLKGRLVYVAGADSQVKLEDCYLKAVGDASSDAIFLTAAGGFLEVRGSRFIMPATYSSNLIQIDDGRLTSVDNDFDVTAHGGSADIIQLLSLGYHSLKGNQFRGAFSSGACVKTTSGGIKISETGSIFDIVNPYSLGGMLALGSELTLSNPIASTLFGAGATCATGYRAQSFNVNASAPTFNLPDKLFIGQEFDVSVLNNSGSTWAGIAFNGGIGTLGGSTPTGQARTYRWRVLDPKALGTPTWVLLGDPSSAFVVP